MTDKLLHVQFQSFFAEKSKSDIVIVQLVQPFVSGPFPLSLVLSYLKFVMFAILCVSVPFKRPCIIMRIHDLRETLKPHCKLVLS